MFHRVIPLRLLSVVLINARQSEHTTEPYDAIICLAIFLVGVPFPRLYPTSSSDLLFIDPFGLHMSVVSLVSLSNYPPRHRFPLSSLSSSSLPLFQTHGRGNHLA